MERGMGRVSRRVRSDEDTGEVPKKKPRAKWLVTSDAGSKNGRGADARGDPMGPTG